MKNTPYQYKVTQCKPHIQFHLSFSGVQCSYNIWPTIFNTIPHYNVNGKSTIRHRVCLDTINYYDMTITVNYNKYQFRNML